VEKTGIYSILVLFSIGITKGKWSTLITELLSFKRLYDSNAPLNIALKTVAPSYDHNMGLKDFCTAMHEWYVANNTLETIEKVYGVIPTPKMPPAKAYEALVKGNVELLNIDEDIAIDRIAASMVVPTPPGIPMIMPGEVFTQEMLDYLRQTKDFDQKFPGFENGIHGVIIKKEGSVNNYYIDCLSQ
jgi:arginine decarboxylase